MAPTVHPPCTPSSSCAPIRCHPTPPPCSQPEKCISNTIKKGSSKFCPSAVSIMSTKGLRTCTECSKCGGRRKDPKKHTATINKYLKDKKKEQALIKQDRLTGGHKYDDYIKKKLKKKPEGKGPKGCCVKPDIPAGPFKRENFVDNLYAKKRPQRPSAQPPKKSKCTIL